MLNTDKAYGNSSIVEPMFGGLSMLRVMAANAHKEAVENLLLRDLNDT
jgi:hypothetical protein